MKSGQEEIVRNSQNSRIKSVLEAADRKAERPIAAIHVGTATEEDQVGGACTTNWRTPIEAVATHNDERGIAVMPVAACCKL